jgi:predicted RNA-binding Zn ribbon-like protein
MKKRQKPSPYAPWKETVALLNSVSINFLRSAENTNAAVKQRFVPWFEQKRKELGASFFALDSGECRKIENYLREIVSPSGAARLITIKDASRILRLSEKKIQSLIERHAIKSFPHANSVLILESSLYNSATEKRKYFEGLRKLQKDALERFRLEINRHLQTDHITFTVEEDGYHPNLDLTSEKNTAWAYASILFVNLEQHDSLRLKECKECRSFFWDYSKNKSAEYCWWSFCGDVVNYKNVKESRRRAEQKKKS